MTYEELVQHHIDAFGVEPVITGVNRFDITTTVDGIIDAIRNGIPYVEKSLDEDQLI